MASSMPDRPPFDDSDLMLTRQPWQALLRDDIDAPRKPGRDGWRDIEVRIMSRQLLPIRERLSSLPKDKLPNTLTCVLFFIYLFIYLYFFTFGLVPVFLSFFLSCFPSFFFFIIARRKSDKEFSPLRDK